MSSRTPLLLRDADWASFRRRVESDERLATLREQTIHEATLILDQPNAERVIVGKRLLAVTRQVLARSIRLALAFRLTDDRRYVDRFIAEARSACAFSDFGPHHYLDVGEMSLALVLGLEWFGDEIPDSVHREIRQALRDKVLDAVTPDAWWWTVDSNWSAVCMAGVAAAALAQPEEHRHHGDQLQRIRQNIDHVFACYEPDGVYPEGPAYWSYGTTFAVLLIETLRALGEDDMLEGAIGDGFEKSATFRLLSEGPSLRMFNFYDCHARDASLDPALFWFDDGAFDTRLLRRQIDLLATAKGRSREAYEGADRYMPLALLWADRPIPEASSEDPPTVHWLGRGDLEVGVHEDSATGNYLAFKCGAGNQKHGQLDAGTFVADFHSRRFALDLGAENYPEVEPHLPGFWSAKPGSDRWKLVRYQNQFHNTLTIGDHPHDPEGLASVVDRAADERTTSIDLTAPLGRHVRHANRTFTFADDAIRIVDEVSQPSDAVHWTMLTEAAVEPASDGFVLTIDDVRVRLRIADAAGVVFSTARVDDAIASYESANPGVTRLRLTSPPADVVRLDVTLAPTPSS
ncbi:MAG: heparinase II/III family protein [Planctomycetota bacterium]